MRTTTEKRLDRLSAVVTGLDSLALAHGFHRITFQVEGLPPTINHYYVTGRRGNVRGAQRYLSDEALRFRDVVVLATRRQMLDFRRTGVIEIVMAFFSPRWVAADRSVREMDVDNRTKPMIDAIKLAMGIPDELVWNIHELKILSSQEKTVCWVYDLGDIVEILG